MRMLGVNKVSLADLAKRGVIVGGLRRGSYVLEASMGEHLRELAAGRSGEDAGAARARLGSAQADLTEAKAKQLPGELVPAAEVEKLYGHRSSRRPRSPSEHR